MKKENDLVETDDLLLMSYHGWTNRIAKANNAYFKRNFTKEHNGKLICIFCEKYEFPRIPSNFIIHVERDIARDPSILKRFPTTMVHPDVMRTLKTKWLKCLKCDFKTKHKGAYNIHQVMHNGTRPFTCPFCNYTATRREHLTQHKTLAHEALSNRQKTCSKYEGYKLHDCENQTKKCKYCDFETNLSGQLAEHTKRQHPDSSARKNYQPKCSDCGYKARNKSELELHIKNNHGKITISCSLCGFKTSSHIRYNQHVDQHHTDIPWSKKSKMFKCDICKFQSKNIEHVDVHQEDKHGIQKQFTCGKCSSSFNSRRNLRRHWTKECYVAPEEVKPLTLELKTENHDLAAVKSEPVVKTEIQSLT